MTNTYPRDTVEYVSVPVGVADDPDGNPVDISGDTVRIAITRAPAAHVWLPAEWVGDSWTGTSKGQSFTYRRARTTDPITFSSANYPDTKYTVYVTPTDSPETPIIKAGDLLIN